MSAPGRDHARQPRVVLAPEIAEIAGSVTTRLPELVDRVVQRILAEIEFYRDRDVVSLEDLRDSVRSNLESMVGQLTTDRPPDLSAPRATGRRRAEQGTPLADILHAYRVGFTELWEAIVDEARRSAQAPPETLVRYRLRRLQEHTGRSLDDPRAVAELLAALDALSLMHGTSWPSVH